MIEDKVFQYDHRTDPTVLETTRATPAATTGNMGLYLASIGLKVNPVGRLLLVGNVLISIGDSGLQDRVTPVFGVDYSF